MQHFVIKAIKTANQYKDVMAQIRSLWSCPENYPKANLPEA
jgi:hypothetical protein